MEDKYDVFRINGPLWWESSRRQVGSHHKGSFGVILLGWTNCWRINRVSGSWDAMGLKSMTPLYWYWGFIFHNINCHTGLMCIHFPGVGVMYAFSERSRQPYPRNHMEMRETSLKLQGCHVAKYVVTDGCRYGATCDDKVGIMTTLGFQCCWFRHDYVHKSMG